MYLCSEDNPSLKFPFFFFCVRESGHKQPHKTQQHKENTEQNGRAFALKQGASRNGDGSQICD